MSISWLDFILSRRYAITATGDPIPRIAAAGSSSADGGAGCGLDSALDGDLDHGSTKNEPTKNELDASGPSADTTAHSAADTNTSPCDTAHSVPQATKQRDAGPFLILANSPSLIDPLLLYAHLSMLKPLVVLRHEQSAALRMFAGAADIVVLPPAPAAPTADAAETNPEIEAEIGPSTTTYTALSQVADALAQGRSVLLWPSPHVQHTGYECVPAHNAAFSLLQLLVAREQNLPDLFLVRTEGVWGSRFSWYRGQNPSFTGALWTQAPAMLLGPFLKRRPVRLVIRRHALRPHDLQQRNFQTMLNGWFGAGHEGAVLVPRLPLCRIRSMPLEALPQAEACAVVQAAMLADASSAQPSPLPEAAPELPTNKTCTCTAGGTADGTVSGTTRMPEGVTAGLTTDPTTTFAVADDAANTQGGANSAYTVQHDANTDTFHGPTHDETAGNTPLADIIPAVPRTPPLLPVQHALTRQGSVTDASYGHHFSRRTLLGLAKAIGTLLGPVPASRIGMSLPCGAGAMATYIAILDCTLEDDRIPVLLDPNMSPEQLAHCAQETGITHVVTSRIFNGRGLPPNTLPVYLEDITSAQVMRGSALSFMGFAGTTEVDSVAAIFCSATTQGAHAQAAHIEPVPLLLRHQDLMTSLHSLIEHLSAPPLNVHSVSMLGCLPPHSPLGLLTNVVLPLTCGVPIVTANTTQDSKVLARSAENYGVNFFTGSPASMRSLLHEARTHLPFRYVMLSQEPCPPDLLALIPKACPHARIFSADMHGTIVLL